MFWICLIIAIVLLCIAGCMSGLTVGFESIDEMTLDIKMKNGTPEEKRQATEI